jgi:hypothetical protein
MEEHFDNQPASGSIRMGAAAHRGFPHHLVRGAFGQYRDVVPECGGVWLMTRFTTSPVLIALMQTATTLPVFLVGLPAVAFADIMNRRAQRPDLYRVDERAPAARPHLRPRPGRQSTPNWSRPPNWPPRSR